MSKVVCFRQGFNNILSSDSEFDLIVNSYNAQDYCSRCQSKGRHGQTKCTCGSDTELSSSSNTSTSNSSNKKKKSIKGKATKKSGKKPKVSTICFSNCRFDVIRRVAKRFGMKEAKLGDPWNIFWTDVSISVERAKEMKQFQKINHFPGMLEICRKDLLCRNLNRMMKLFPKEYTFFPKTWCLPAEYVDVAEYARKHRNKVYILKPDIGCQGRGIYITKNVKELRAFEKMICQLYITKPFLLDGYKFDLRVYVLITCCDPLRIYVYNEGLARFATKYYKEPSSSNLSNVYMHLTNYSVNKHSRTFVIDDESGSKRRFSTFNKCLSERNIDVQQLWDNIDEVIIKTVLSIQPTLKHSYQVCFQSHGPNQACFELLGFDFLLDFKLKPYLLEVNHSPSFHTDAIIDKEIKESLLSDTFIILNLTSDDKQRILAEEKQKIQDRLLNVLTNNKNQQQPVNGTGDSNMAAKEAQERWEESHLGNYRKVYPCLEMNKYEKFYKQTVSSLFSDTCSSRAREAAGKLLREERQEKATKLANGKEFFVVKDRSRGESKMTKERKLKASPPKPFEPTIIDMKEERVRSDSLVERAKLLKRHGVLQKIYDCMKETGKMAIEDHIKYGRSNEWGLFAETMNQTGIEDLIECVNKKSIETRCQTSDKTVLKSDVCSRENLKNTREGLKTA